MSYRLSYPLYLDVSEANKSQLMGRLNASPTTALLNLNAFYESIISADHNGRSPAHGLPHNAYYSAGQHPTKRLASEMTALSNGSKSSFSIEAILGISGGKSDAILSAETDYDLRINYRSDYSSQPKASHYSMPNTVASVSPDSTAKEQNSFRSNQRIRNKTLSSNVMSLQMNDNKNKKRSFDSVESSDAAVNRSTTKSDLSDRLADTAIPAPKSKRVRTIFTPEQLEKLEAEFERQQYMVGPERLYLASALSLSEAQVKVWFQNRRIKWRKQHLEMEKARFNTTGQSAQHLTPEDDIEPELTLNSQMNSYNTLDNDSDFLTQSPQSSMPTINHQ